MRIGIYLPFCDQEGKLLDAPGVAERARLVEAAGLDGIWLGDHLPTPSSDMLGLPDPILFLSVAAAATRNVEIGTNIYGVPVRNRFDVLQHLYTLETLFPRRFTTGLGTGSSSDEYDDAGVSWEGRFCIFREAVDEMRAMCEPPAEGVLGTSEGSMVGTWAQIVGLPRLVIGAWSSEPQLRRAATEFDGWMTSGWKGLEGVGWKKSFGETIKRYRDFGGKRAMISTVQLDLHRPTSSVDGSERFDLFCSPAEASDRLGYLEELGYNDVIVNRIAASNPHREGPHMTDFTLEDLEEIRSLVPKDEPIVNFAEGSTGS